MIVYNQAWTIQTEVAVVASIFRLSCIRKLEVAGSSKFLASRSRLCFIRNDFSRRRRLAPRREVASSRELGRSTFQQCCSKLLGHGEHVSTLLQQEQQFLSTKASRAQERGCQLQETRVKHVSTMLQQNCQVTASTFNSVAQNVLVLINQILKHT